MTVLLHRTVSKQIRLSERQVALADRIFALAVTEMIGSETRDALLERLWENLDKLDAEITNWEQMMVK